MAAPTAAFATAPSLHLGRTADVIDAVPMKTVLDPSDPTVDVKVTNRTGKEVTLHGWLNDVPAIAAVPARSAIVKLTFPAMTEGQAKLKLSLTAEGVDDTEVHEVLVVARGYGHQTQWPSPTPSSGTSLSPTTNTTMNTTANASEAPKPSDSMTPKPGDSKTPKPQPSKTKSPKPQPSWSKWPKPSQSWTHSMTPSVHPSELPKTGDTVRSYVLLGGGLLLFGMFVLGLAWALGRRTASESAREG